MVRAIKEEMRLHPPVTSMFFRVATRDDVVQGVEIPRGSLIFLCPMLVHTSMGLWNSPRTFDAGHWTAPRGDSSEIVEAKTDPDDVQARPCPRAEGAAAARYLPFGAGPHSCQGRFFAAEEMLTVVQTVLEMVDLEVIEDGDLLKQDLAEQVTFHVYSRPAHDVRLRVSKVPASS